MNYAQDRANKLVKTVNDIANTFVHELHAIVQSILTQLEDEILLGQDRGERIFEHAIKIKALEDLARQDATPPPPTEPEPEPEAVTSYYGNSTASVLVDRLRGDLSLSGLAMVCGVHPTSITNWSNGKPIREANYTRLIDLCHAFKLPTTGDSP